MKITKYKVYLIISMIYVAVTGLINLYGYFNLPEEIATQFGLTEEQVNRMPTPLYLFVSFGAVLLLSLFCITKRQEQKLKYIVVNTLIVIANIAMIVSQL
jgi:hypothetical protein